MRWRLLIMLGVGLVWAAPVHAQPAAADHKVTIVEGAPTVVGQRGAVSVTIAAEPGYTISREGPLRVDVSLPRGATATKRRYVRADAADARADAPRFDVRYAIEAAGDYTMTLRLSFWVCATRSCRPVSLERTAAVRGVEPAPPTPTPAPSP